MTTQQQKARIETAERLNDFKGRTNPDVECFQVFRRGSKWFAHLYFKDGRHWSYYLNGFYTKARILREINAITPGAKIIRGIDETSTNQGDSR